MKRDFINSFGFKYFTTFILLIFVISSCNFKAPEVSENDWPQFKKDNYRSANSSINFDVKTQGKSWVYKAAQKPVPAWYGPAKEDAFAVSGPLPSMRDYDLSYYPIIVGSKLYHSVFFWLQLVDELFNFEL